MTAFFPLAFPVFFAGMWIGVSALLSRLSGWSALAPKYPAAGKPDGERLRWTSAQVGGVSFRSCLNVTIAAAGLHLVPSLPFRLFMPPVLIPWSGVRFEGFKTVLFYKYACFRLGGAEGPLYCAFLSTGARIRPRLTDEHGRAYDEGRPFAGSLFDRRMLIVAAAAGVAGLVAALFAATR